MRRGFTLIEVMIAVGLLAAIGATLAGVISNAIDARDQVSAMSDRYDEVRIAMNRMAYEISMAYVRPPNTSEEPRCKTLFREDSEGEGERLIFTSFSHVRRVRDAKESDQNVLTYWVDANPDDSGEIVLLRKEKARIDERTGEDTFEEKDARTDVLCTKVKNIAFDYWDETDKEWDEEWDTDSVENGNKLPPRVRIRLSVEDADGKIQEFQTQTEIVLQAPIVL